MEIKDVENLANLARMDLTEEEKQGLIKDFASILAYVDTIKEAEVGDVELKNDVYNAWREDIPRDTQNFDPALLTGQFPESKDNFLKVKKIL